MVVFVVVLTYFFILNDPTSIYICRVLSKYLLYNCQLTHRVPIPQHRWHQRLFFFFRFTRGVFLTTAGSLSELRFHISLNI